MKIMIGCDHGGFELKEVLKKYLADKGYEVEDAGSYTPDRVDYPDYAKKVGEAVAAGKAEQGILICGTGLGMSIAANKIHGIRAAVCGDCYSAEKAREHGSWAPAWQNRSWMPTWELLSWAATIPRESRKSWTWRNKVIG